LAVFGDAKQNSDAMPAIAGRADRGRHFPQYSLFANSDESVINDLRNANLENMSDDELRDFLTQLQNRIV
jgi:hypothetical protein